MSSVLHIREENGDVTTDRRDEDRGREAEGTDEQTWKYEQMVRWRKPKLGSINKAGRTGWWWCGKKAGMQEGES